MNYKSIIFREFTDESLQRIKRYRQEELVRMTAEELERQARCENNSDERRCLKKALETEPSVPKRVPNKELAVGQTLPRILQNKFPDKLIGKPIEEIDDYYRIENVCTKHFESFLKPLFFQTVDICRY